MKKKRNNIFLVTGIHRSGTTWIGKTLASAKHTFFIFEPFNKHQINWLLDIDDEYYYLYYEDFLNPRKIYKNYESLLKLKMPPLKNLFKITGFTTFKHCFGLYFDFLRNKLTNKKAKIIIKDPFAIFSTESFFLKYNIKPIIVIRHPAAYYYSVKKGDWDIDLNLIIKQKNLINRPELKQFKNELLTIGDSKEKFIDRQIIIWNLVHSHIAYLKDKYPEFIYIKHEDISRYPEKNYERLFAYCNLKFDESIRKVIRKNTKSSNDIELSKVNVLNIQRNSKKVVDIWKSKLNPLEIEFIKNKTAITADKFYTNEDW